jgi:hypothetical protein
MIHRVNHCYGLTLWSWRKRIELWLCFSGVPKHSHPGQHVEIVPLFGYAVFSRVKPGRNCFTIQSLEISPRKWFRAFSIPDGWTHWFTLNRKPLLFLNITTGRSAAENFAA